MKNAPNLLLKWMASLQVTVIGLLLLFVLTSLGTWYQVEHGLYAAQVRFFHSWIIWLGGFFPFPGTQLVMWVLFFNLFAAAKVHFIYKWKRVGILIQHFGLIILLVGSFYTYHYAEESFLTIAEGGKSNVSSAYSDWELAVWQGNEEERAIQAVSLSNSAVGQWFTLTPKLKVYISAYFPNCSAFGPSKTTPDMQYLNVSGIASIVPKKPSTQPSNDTAGLILKAEFESQTAKNILLYGGEAKPLQISHDNSQYHIKLRKKRTVLPITVKLLDFRKLDYMGTEMAKSYESQVEIKTPTLTRSVLISMNNPLRVEDFTLFQSSYFTENDGTEYSTFSVVKNAGRLFPYISSIVVFFGLLLHFCSMLFNKLKRRTRETL